MIALCEDNEKDRKLILDMLEEWWQKTGRREKVQCFPDAGELLDAVLDGRLRPDILLMDIYFDGQDMTGLDAVREMQRAGLDADVIFLTSSSEHSLAAWGLEARQYLVKPVAKGLFFKTLDKCHKELPPSVLIKQHGGTVRRVFCASILYSETRGNDQIVHLRTGEEIATRLSSTKMREALQTSREFVNLGPSYIINLIRVVSLENESVLLEGGGGNTSPFPTSDSLSLGTNTLTSFLPEGRRTWARFGE